MSIPEFINSEQFERFFNRYHAHMVLYASRFTDDAETARDIVQEVFLKTWENRDTIEISSSLTSYLFVAIRNRCANYIRQKEISGRYASDAEEEIRKMESEYYSSVEEQNLILYEQETSEIIRNCVRNLPDKCRQIFELSRFDGMKSTEIAKKLNISVRTVETQIYRALKTLKDKLIKQ